MNNIKIREAMIIPSIQKLRNRLNHAQNSADSLVDIHEIMPILNAFEQYMVDTSHLKSIALMDQAMKPLGDSELDNPMFIAGYIHGMLHTRDSVEFFKSKNPELIIQIMAYLAKRIESVTNERYDSFVASEKKPNNE